MNQNYYLSKILSNSKSYQVTIQKNLDSKLKKYF